MTERNFEQELIHDYYYDMENGHDNETISYSSLIRIITELCDRIESLEWYRRNRDELSQWTLSRRDV